MNTYISRQRSDDIAAIVIVIIIQNTGTVVAIVSTAGTQDTVVALTAI